MEEPNDINLVPMLWLGLLNSTLLMQKIARYFKLTNLSIVQMISSVEDERCFSTLTFMKSKLHNKVINHIDFVGHMLAQNFYILESFLYHSTI
jgi:hypothetical protein